MRLITMKIFQKLKSKLVFRTSSNIQLNEYEKRLQITYI